MTSRAAYADRLLEIGTSMDAMNQTSVSKFPF
jgi:hypothetical protein